MQTPVSGTLEDFLTERRRWLDKECQSNPERTGEIRHKCGQKLKAVEAWVAVETGFGNGVRATGETFHTAIPYCPACEPAPTAYGRVNG